MLNSKSGKTLLLVVICLFAATSAFAVTSSSPAGKATDVPGLKVEGDAAGTKLNGVIAISFSVPYCDEGYEQIYGPCEVTLGVNAADAMVAVRLSETNVNNKGNIEAIYFNLGKVPFMDVPAVQEAIIAEIKPWVLEEFFGVVGDPQTLESYNIYMKDFSRYVQANVNTSPPETVAAEFVALLDITLAIN